MTVILLYVKKTTSETNKFIRAFFFDKLNGNVLCSVQIVEMKRNPTKQLTLNFIWSSLSHMNKYEKYEFLSDVSNAIKTWWFVPIFDRRFPVSLANCLRSSHINCFIIFDVVKMFRSSLLLLITVSFWSMNLFLFGFFWWYLIVEIKWEKGIPNCSLSF